MTAVVAAAPHPQPKRGECCVDALSRHRWSGRRPGVRRFPHTVPRLVSESTGVIAMLSALWWTVEKNRSEVTGITLAVSGVAS